MAEANQMLSAEEILELKKEHHSLEKRMEKIEKNQLSTIVKLSEKLKALMSEIASVREKEKSMWNPDLSTRIKLSKKGLKLSKELNYFVMEVEGEFKNGNIPEDVGKRFVSLAKLTKDNRMDPAKKEFEYFEEIVEFSKRYEKAEEEMKEHDRMLRREQARIQAILAEMSELEKETIDLRKALSYENLLKNLEKLGKLRETYIHSLLSEPVSELLEDIERYSLKDYYQALPGKGEMAELKEFLHEYPAFGKCNVNQLCEFFEYSEKKLSHICPETSRFKKLVLGNKNLFETILLLEKTNFLAADDENEKVMDFYAERIEGAREIVEQIRQLRKEKYSYREEYEKSKRIEKRKEELSKYSKKELEAELRDIGHLIELLHSDHPG
jgi:hypothetical protein